MRTDWVTVVGAVIGRDADAISAGVAATQAVDQSSAAFFRRLQLEPLNVQSAMIVLRQCGVPQMNYSLRCMPPSCIAQQAAAFDDLVIGAAQSKCWIVRPSLRRVLESVQTSHEPRVRVGASRRNGPRVRQRGGGAAPLRTLEGEEIHTPSPLHLRAAVQPIVTSHPA